MSSFSIDTYLQTFLNWETRLHQAGADAFLLERMQRLLDVFGRPDEGLRFAHVAGTKGKGSTCAFLASILRACGYRVGLYTSPHLHALCERIRILKPDVKGEREAGRGGDAQEPLTSEVELTNPLMPEGAITLQEIKEILRRYHDDIEQLRASGVEITFYELMTAVAMVHFAASKVEVVVLETGLGGRLDATNVIETSVCGITPLGFDHMNILGQALSSIAAEKAGIIKSPFQRVVLASQTEEAMIILKARCAEFNIRPEVVGDDIALAVREITADGVMFDVHGRREYRGLVAPITGLHQAQNAALAIGMAEDLETFGFVLTEEAVRAGVSSVEWPARFERTGASPTVILDCAHTAESARALVETFRAVYPGRKAVVVLGMSMDKDADVFIDALLPITQALVLTKANNPRAMDFLQRPPQLPGLCRFTPDVPGALNEARRMAGEDGIILVTGSVFVCAQARC